MEEMARNLMARQVSPTGGRLRFPHNTAGPTLGAFGAFGYTSTSYYNNRTHQASIINLLHILHPIYFLSFSH
jgi:hypothetical protein